MGAPKKINILIVGEQRVRWENERARETTNERWFRSPRYLPASPLFPTAINHCTLFAFKLDDSSKPTTGPSLHFARVHFRPYTIIAYAEIETFFLIITVLFRTFAE